MIYPVVVVSVAVGILTFIMIKIVPAFIKIFNDFEVDLPAMTVLLINISNAAVNYWWAIPLVPISLVLFVKLVKKFKQGRIGWDMWTLKMPIFGQLVEKNIMARTTRTLGTLVSSGVPILEALNITRDTSNNAVFETLYGKVIESIREGESIAKPLKDHSRPGFHPMAMFFWGFFIPGIGALLYIGKMNARIVDDLVVNMVDVGEETGELDTMLYKVADTYDEEVSVLTESLVSLMEPLLIIFLGGAVGFIVIALFLPLVELIKSLT
jgi:type IV pilus assembly protein PilC